MQLREGGQTLGAKDRMVAGEFPICDCNRVVEGEISNVSFSGTPFGPGRDKLAMARVSADQREKWESSLCSVTNVEKGRKNELEIVCFVLLVVSSVCWSGGSLTGALTGQCCRTVHETFRPLQLSQMPGSWRCRFAHRRCCHLHTQPLANRKNSSLEAWKDLAGRKFRNGAELQISR